MLDTFLGRWLSPVAPTLAAVAIALRLASSSRSRVAWLLIALGQASWAFGAFYYAIALWLADPMPYPSAADAGWLVFYLPTLAGVVLLVRDRTPGRTSAVSLLDAAVGALAIAGAGAALAFGPIVDATGGSHLAIATNLAYPLGDLGLLAVIVGGLAMSGWRVSRGWALLMTGYALFAVADTLYLFQIANDTYSGGLLDAGWVLSSAVVALAAVQPWETVRVRAQAWSAFAFPAIFGALAVGVLTYDHFVRVHLLALALSVASLLAVIARMTLIFRENLQMLDASRVEAATDLLTELGNRRRLPRRPRGAGAGRRGDARAARPRRVQELQRHVRPPRRRRAARPPRTPTRGRGAGRRARTVSAATSSACSPAAPTGRPSTPSRRRTRSGEHGDGFSITSSYGVVTIPAEAIDSSGRRCAWRTAGCTRRSSAARPPPAARARTS